eukprot:EC721711.1.p1 GENE.EC721711.1~~EC721711.1.p1  ORF type:complete len:166 (+),score=34.28 EC721711.1:52-549(+)
MDPARKRLIGIAIRIFLFGLAALLVIIGLATDQATTCSQFACSGWFAGGLYSAGIFSGGMFSVGLYATGFVSIGLVSSGVFSFGVFSFGIFSSGAVVFGLFTAGLLSRGVIPIGWKKSYIPIRMVPYEAAEEQRPILSSSNVSTPAAAAPIVTGPPAGLAGYDQA